MPGEEQKASNRARGSTVNDKFRGIRTKMVGQISLELWIQGIKSAREWLFSGPNLLETPHIPGRVRRRPTGRRCTKEF